jgi:hypothetical protein
VEAQEVQGERPSLNNHIFIPVNVLNSSFSNTKLTMPIGVGSTANFDFTSEVPGLDTLEGLTGEVLFANLGFRYSQKVQDWINFYLKVGLTARLGTNFESILSQGFNTVINFELGSMIKLYQTKKTRLSLSIEVQNYDANFVDINGFVKDIIQGNPYPTIVREIPALTGGGGLHFAWGINDLFGLRAEANYAFGETFTRGESGSLYALKTGIDVDFNSRFSVPLGIALTYAITTEPEIVYVDDQTGKMFFWKIAYTGRKDFDIGIENAIMILPFENIDEKPTINMVSITLSYFFN